jgi:hypothetical protein
MGKGLDWTGTSEHNIDGTKEPRKNVDWTGMKERNLEPPTRDGSGGGKAEKPSTKTGA